jgi:hypothetical protein
MITSKLVSFRVIEDLITFPEDFTSLTMRD